MTSINNLQGKKLPADFSAKTLEPKTLEKKPNTSIFEKEKPKMEKTLPNYTLEIDPSVLDSAKEEVENNQNVQVNGIFKIPDTAGIYEQKRTEAYGKEIEDLTNSERSEFEQAKHEAELDKERRSHYMVQTVELSNHPEEKSEPGVTQTKYGNWTETKIQLYDGKTYNQLSAKDKAKVDEWEKECEKMEQVWGDDAKLPDCPFEQSAEIRVQKDSKILDKGGKIETLPHYTTLPDTKLITPEDKPKISKTWDSPEEFREFMQKMEEESEYRCSVDALHDRMFGYSLDSERIDPQDKAEYEKALKEMEKSGNATKPKELGKGYLKRQVGDYNEITLTTYSGYMYQDLPDDLKEKLDKWENAVFLSNAGFEVENAQEALKCPLNIETTVRIQKIRNSHIKNL